MTLSGGLYGGPACLRTEHIEKVWPPLYARRRTVFKIREMFSELLTQKGLMKSLESNSYYFYEAEYYKDDY